MKKSINKGPLIVFGLIVLVAIGLLVYKQPLGDTIAQQKYGSEIEQFTKLIAEKKCEAGDEVYIGLAQDYTYTKDFKRALATYDAMSQCYPDAYQVVSNKYKLLLNNRGALYEDWGYYLKNTENDSRNAEKKYQEAVKIFRNIIQTFQNTNILSTDEIKNYENRIEQIQKYHLGK